MSGTSVTFLWGALTEHAAHGPVQPCVRVVAEGTDDELRVAHATWGRDLCDRTVEILRARSGIVYRCPEHGLVRKASCMAEARPVQLRDTRFAP